MDVPQLERNLVSATDIFFLLCAQLLQLNLASRLGKSQVRAILLKEWIRFRLR